MVYMGYTIQLPAKALWIFVVGSLTSFILVNMVFTFGEEFGWRGYLLVRWEKHGRTRAAIGVGAVWGVWHAPIIVLMGYNYPGHPGMGIIMMTLFTISFGVLQAWLRFASGSVWPPVLAHAAFNAQSGAGLLFLTSADSLLRAPVGLFAIIPFATLAAWLIAARRLEGDRATGMGSGAQVDSVP